MKHIVILLLLLSGVAEARTRDKRDGVNFGTSFRIISEENDTGNAEGTASQATSTYAVNPFLGFAFYGLFNLGISSTIESTSITEESKPTNSNQTTTTVHKNTLGGTSLFARLLFGRIMFMEIAGGVYRGSSAVTQSSVTAGDQFSGNTTSSNKSGIGYGYQAGIGLEIPMNDGFYLTGEFTSRTLLLKDYQDTTGKTHIGNSKSEVQFGIIHYLQ